MTAVTPRRSVICALGVTQILAWGSSYYLPAVLATSIARDTGWPLTGVVGGLSLGLLMAALISPRVGAGIERSGGRRVLAASAIAIGSGQIGLALAPNLALYVAAWLIMGLGMGAGLYDAAFGTLGRLYGSNARAAITTLTLFGGFASTACWPLSAFLVSSVGWRGTCLAYAAIQFGFALPVYMFVIPKATPAPTAAGVSAAAVGTAGRPRHALLAVLATTLTLAATISSLLSVHLLTILQAGGTGLSAAVALGAIVGPSQVAARALEMAVSRYHHPIWTKLASVSFVTVGVLALWADVPVTAGALIFYGAGIGLESIARGTLPLALFGPSGYAVLMGRLAMPSLIGQAAAPSIGAFLLVYLGPHGTLATVSAVAALNVVLTIGLGWMVLRPKRDS